MADLLSRVKGRYGRWSTWQPREAPPGILTLLANENARYVRVEYANYTYEWRRA